MKVEICTKVIVNSLNGLQNMMQPEQTSVEVFYGRPDKKNFLAGFLEIIILDNLPFYYTCEIIRKRETNR